MPTDGVNHPSTEAKKSDSLIASPVELAEPLIPLPPQMPSPLVTYHTDAPMVRARHTLLQTSSSPAFAQGAPPTDDVTYT